MSSLENNLRSVKMELENIKEILDAHPVLKQEIMKLLSQNVTQNNTKILNWSTATRVTNMPRQENRIENDFKDQRKLVNQESDQENLMNQELDQEDTKNQEHHQEDLKNQEHHQEDLTNQEHHQEDLKNQEHHQEDLKNQEPDQEDTKNQEPDQEDLKNREPDQGDQETDINIIQAERSNLERTRNLLEQADVVDEENLKIDELQPDK